MDHYTNFIKGLQTRVWRTAGARFAASRRLARREQLAMASIAGLSIVGLFLGIMSLSPGAVQFANVSNLSAILGIAVSLLVLIISLLEAAGHHAVNADQLHRNAVNLNEVQRELGALISQHPVESDASWLRANQLQADYEAHIRECSVNHQPIDDLHFVVQHRDAPEFQAQKFTGLWGWVRALFVQARYVATFTWLPIFSCIVVIALWIVVTK